MIVEGSPSDIESCAPSDCLMEPLLDLPNTVSFEATEFNFEFSDHNYRYFFKLNISDILFIEICNQ